MEILTTKDGKKVMYEAGVASVVDVEELEKQKKFLEDTISQVKEVDEKELLAWARANYPMTDTSATTKEIERIDNLLSLTK